jgi:hypothetical protein
METAMDIGSSTFACRVVKSILRIGEGIWEN